MRLYPLLLLLIFLSGYKREHKQNAKYELDKHIADCQWLKTYDSLDTKTFAAYRTVSSNWKNNGFFHFGWKDTAWHFAYGSVPNYEFSMDKLYTIKKNLSMDNSASLKKDFVSSCMYAILSAKDYVQRSGDSIQSYKYYLRQVGKEHMVWAVRNLPEQFNVMAVRKFRIYMFRFSGTGLQVRSPQVSRTASFFSNTSNLTLIDTVKLPTIASVYGALHYQDKFRRKVISSSLYNTYFKTINGKAIWEIKKK